MLDLISIVTRIEGQFISEATAKETSLRVISEHFNMLAIQLLADRDLSLLDENPLWCVASEHSKGRLGAKEKAAFSFKHIWIPLWGKEHQRHSLPEWATYWFVCSLQILDQKCVEFSSQLDCTLVRSLQQILKELGQFKCPKVWKWWLVFRATERVKTSIASWYRIFFCVSRYLEKSWEMSITQQSIGTLNSFLLLSS